MIYLIDTCLASETIKPKPDAKAGTWLANLFPEQQRYSAITVGELQRGVARLPAGARRSKLSDWLSTSFIPNIADRVIAIDAPVATAWGELMALGESLGRVLPVLDAYIAATALVHDLTVATCNDADFRACGVKVINPWQ